jgi:hypothetical protein
MTRRASRYVPRGVRIRPSTADDGPFVTLHANSSTLARSLWAHQYVVLVSSAPQETRDRALVSGKLN